MAAKRTKGDALQHCPKCGMGMIVVAGFGLDPERKTRECLQCGHIEKPTKPIKISDRRVSRYSLVLAALRERLRHSAAHYQTVRLL